MAIPENVRNDLNIINEAAERECLAVVETTDEQGEPAYVLCATYRDEGGYNMVPLARMLSDDAIAKLRAPEGATVERNSQQEAHS